MSDNNNNDNNDNKTQVTVARMTLIGTLGTAIIGLIGTLVVFKITGDPPPPSPSPTISSSVSPACDLRKTSIKGVHISSKSQENDAQAYLKAINNQNPSPLSMPEQPQLVSKQNNDDGTFPKQNIMVRVFYRTDDCAARLVASLSPSAEAKLDPHYTYQDNNGNRPKEGELEVWYPWKKP